MADKRSQVVDEIERDGVTILVYDNGMERRKDNGRMMRPPNHALITPDKANQYHRKRQEKQARLLREAIVTETMDKLDVPHHGSAAAIAAAGGILWREIVLDPNAYPRDRMEAWEKLGKYAEVLPTDLKRQDTPTIDQATDLVEAVSGLVSAIREALERS